MAGLYGDFVAKTVQQGDCSIVATEWRPLTANGTSGASAVPMSGRRHIRYQIKANPGGALALQYVAKAADGTYTTPTTANLAKVSTVLPGNTTTVEPIGDNIQVFGRLVKKKGFTFGSIRVVVTEFA